jgi:2,4-dienoyl-CoA reductase (NADPH2)
MANSSRFTKLMEPGYIGKVRLNNRMIKTGVGTGLIGQDGSVTENLVKFYETIARGGVGLVIHEFCTVEFPRGAFRLQHVPRIDNDSFIPGYARLAEAVHKHGVPFFFQLMHTGAWWGLGQKGIDPGDRIMPSAIPKEELPGAIFVPVRAMTTDEVEEMIEKFASAAVRTQKAGFDGVEINASHHHFVNGFFSRFWNRRHDRYGCDSLENRARFLCETVQEIKRRCGHEYPVTCIINGAEYGVPNGTTLEEAKRFGRMLEAAGMDAIQVRVGSYNEFEGILQPEQMLYPELPEAMRVKELDWSHNGEGATVPMGTAIKEVVKIPVFMAGRLGPEIGERILREGRLDFIGMARRLFADPELPRKVAEGRIDDIAPCSGCNYCWHVRFYKDIPVRCRINASWGLAWESGASLEPEPAPKKKKVLVAGGGPAGLETARVAALRGHDVYLYEKETSAGGAMRLAAFVKDIEMDNILKSIRYLSGQIARFGGKIVLGKEVTPAVIEEIKPDVLVLAEGGIPARLQIPGIDNRKALTAEQLHRRLKSYIRFLGPKAVARLSKIWMPVGKRVVVIGGSLHGCQLAEFLVKRRRKVTIVETSPDIGEGLISDHPDRLFRWFKQKGVALLPGVTYREINDKGLVITTQDGERQLLEADSIIVALPFQRNEKLLNSIKDKVPEVYHIGDSARPAYMPEAIAEGYRIGRDI